MKPMSTAPAFTALHGSLFGAPLVEVLRWAEAGEPADEFGTIPLYSLRLAEVVELIPFGAEGTIHIPWAELPTAMDGDVLAGEGWSFPLPGGIRHRLDQELAAR
jgi:hypothetical protein